jgi:hypothetical protein
LVTKEKEDQYNDKEVAERRDAVIKRMIAMPPKPHSEMKVGKKPEKETEKGNQIIDSYSQRNFTSLLPCVN